MTTHRMVAIYFSAWYSGYTRAHTIQLEMTETLLGTLTIQSRPYGSDARVYTH